LTVLDIKSLSDIERVEKAILNNEDFSIGEIKPIPFKLKLDGGRFKDYDPKFVDKFVARVILSQQANYEKMLKVIEKKYNVKIPDEAKILKFELEKGSLELLADLIALGEIFKNMESLHQLYSVLGIAGGWFSYLGFSKYFDSKKNELEIQSKDKLNQLNGEEKEKYLETINKAIEAMKEISNNTTLQKAINTPKKDLASMLEDGEELTINDNTSYKIINTSEKDFEYTPPVVDDIEEEVEEVYTVSNYYFRSKEKYFKLDGISVTASSIAMPVAKRIKMISQAEAMKPVTLKLKLIKDGLTHRIKDVYILDYIE